jgi:hypothetical protein
MPASPVCIRMHRFSQAKLSLGSDLAIFAVCMSGKKSLLATSPDRMIGIHVDMIQKCLFKVGNCHVTASGRPRLLKEYFWRAPSHELQDDIELLRQLENLDHRVEFSEEPGVLPSFCPNVTLIPTWLQMCRIIPWRNTFAAIVAPNGVSIRCHFKISWN